MDLVFGLDRYSIQHGINDMMTLDQALDAATALSPEQRDMLTDILVKRRVEERRKELAKSASDSIRAMEKGILRPQTADEVIEDLRAGLEASVDE